MLATETYRCSLEAEVAWRRTSALLRSWWFDSRADFALRRWRQEYGVRIQGTPADPLAIVGIAISAEYALNDLRDLNHKAHRLLMHDVKRPYEAWCLPNGMGVVDEMGISTGEAQVLFGAGKAFVYGRMEGEATEAEAIEALVKPPLIRICEADQ
jgi:hypothetical protein